MDRDVCVLFFRLCQGVTRSNAYQGWGGGQTNSNGFFREIETIENRQKKLHQSHSFVSSVNSRYKGILTTFIKTTTYKNAQVKKSKFHWMISSSSLSSTTSSSSSSFAFALIAIGYLVGSFDILDHVQNLVDSIVIPLYSSLVVVYLLFRIKSEHEPKSISSRSNPTNAFLLKQKQLLRKSKEDQPIDLTGAFKLTENENFEEFLEAQGVPWALRGAANRARPIHRITHIGNIVTIKIEGIIESQTTYEINGPPVKGKVRGRLFEDRVEYIENGICTIKRCDEEDGYTVKVQRVLTKDQQTILMDSTLTFDDKSKEKVTCRQRFQRTE